MDVSREIKYRKEWYLIWCRNSSIRLKYDSNEIEVDNDWMQYDETCDMEKFIFLTNLMECGIF